MYSPAELEAINTLRNSSRSGYRGLSDPKIIEDVLELANMRDDSWTDFARVFARFQIVQDTTTSPADPDDFVRTLVRNQGIQRDFEADMRSYMSLRDELVSMLKEIKKSIAGARRKLSADLAKRLKGVVVLAHAEFVASGSGKTGRLVIEPRSFLPDIETAVVYAVALLLDDSQPAGDRRSFGARLRYCALGNATGVSTPRHPWFLSFSEGRGGPMPKYCCPEHRDAAARATVAERVAKHRAKTRATKAK